MITNKLSFFWRFFGKSILVMILVYALAFPACHQRESTEDEILHIAKETEKEIAVYKAGDGSPILVQNLLPNKRPYLHPIQAPDGKGLLTEFQPSHHLHQTGLYWGLKEVNGRDFFMNWEEDHWRKVAAKILQPKGETVSWESTYEMLDEDQEVMMVESQVWEIVAQDHILIMDLLWTGEAVKDLKMGQFYVGGLFLRMPWTPEVEGRVVNASRQENQEAEQQRAIWLDIGLKVQGRDDLAHVAIFDHPENPGFPVSWRVDGELGVGPSRQILGEWRLNKGEKEKFRYRLFCYTGPFDHDKVMQAWKDFVVDY
ncbi:DUF6807 family protein [Pleomorphovibrio marinus]|uniref:DUF6807 family protein n=1 Tax=Pleomorphovibrio marinus TaxID=2164132 RepID=UPI000E0A3854|nr:DUF6807 family protein [Pleomorphovibrio marinus]